MHRTAALFLAFFCCVSLAGGGDIRFDENLTGWTKIKKENVSLDGTVRFADEPAVRLADGARILKVFDLEPDSVYELSFCVRGQDIPAEKDDGARVMVNGGKIWKRFTSDAKHSTAETGTFDWKKGRGRIDTSRMGTKIRIYLASGSVGTVWYGDLKLIKKSVKAKERSFRRKYGDAVQNALLIPRGVFGFFEPGEKVVFDILLKSSSNDLEYDISVRDENGKVVGTLPRSKVTKDFSLKGQPCGYYVVEGNFYSGGKKVYSVQSGFVSAEKILRRDPFFQMGFGLQPDMVEGIRRIGVGTISLKLSGWNNPGAVGKPERIFNWLYNNRVKPYMDAGGFEYSANIGVSLSCSLRSAQEQKEGWPLISDKLLDHYLRFLDLALDKLGGKVHTWSIQQETPSNAVMSKFAGSWTEAMSNFTVLVRMGSRRIRARQPDAKILVGGCNVQSTLRDIERITLSDITKEFDVYVIDAYTGNWNLTLGDPTPPETGLTDFYREASALSESLGKGRIIRNEELGYCINYGAAFDKGLAVTQAELTARQLILTKASPVSGFELHMPTCSVSEKIKDGNNCMTTVWKPAVFGGKSYQMPLPGGAMYITAASQLAFVHTPRLFHLESFYSCVFTRPDNRSLLVLWNIESEKELTFTLPVPAEMVSMYGRKTRLNAGKLTLRVGRAPVYLVLDHPAQKLAAEIRDAIIRHVPEFKGAGFVTGEGTAKIFIRNLTDATRTGELEGAGKVTLLPGRIASFIKTAAEKCRFVSDSGRTYEFKIIRNGFPVPRIRKKVVLDGSGSWLEGLPAGVLKYPDHIRPRSALQPELSYFKTDFNPNGHNVSAKYWTACDDDNFYIAAEVDDPVHLQRYTGLDLWRDDCLQIAFASGDFVPRELRSAAEAGGGVFLTYGIALTPQGPVAAKFAGDDRGVKSLPVNVTRRNGRTFYEAAIPFKELGGRPSRFGFVIFDNNCVSKKSAPYWLEFSSGIAGGQDPGKLKLIQYR